MIDRKPRTRRRPAFQVESLENRGLLSVLAPTQTIPAEVHSASQMMPMMGTIKGVATIGQATNDPQTHDVIVQVESTGSGNLSLSYLGHVTLTETHQMRLLASTNYTTSDVEDGQATIIAANGDHLSLAFHGSAVRTQYGFNDTFNYTITGGTGRFTCATGKGVIQSTDVPGANDSDYPFIAVFYGIISSVSSN